MIEVRPAPPEHYPWLAERAGITVHPNLRAIEAVDGDRIVGMVGYDGWTENCCSIHVACDYPAALRRIIRPGFEVPFRLGRNVVLASVLSTNHRSMALTEHLGFQRICVIKGGWTKDVDVHLFEMRKETCRWVQAE